MKKQLHLVKVYTDYNEMFTDPEVDVIYITTPHNTHKKFMRQAIENGKHILVEKSITLNSDELNEMAVLAEEKHVIIGEKIKRTFGDRCIGKSKSYHDEFWKLQRI